MKKRIIFLGACLFLMGCSRACEIAVPPDPVVLFAEANSFQSINQATTAFSRLGEFSEIEGRIEDVKCVEQPVNRIEYRHSMYGEPGRLELVFYFGRLAETRFHPDEPLKFFAKTADKGLPSAPGQEQQLGDKVLWASGRAYAAETLGASDRRLSDEFQSWIRKRD